MSETILIVDDEESILKALSGILEDEGYKTIRAGDGIEALDAVEREVPDLVMLDIWMPRMEGLETLQRLKELHPGLIVVMMSGHGTIETAVKSTKMGAYDFIEKPLSLEKIIITVNNALGVSRLRQENTSLRGLVLQDHELVGKSQVVMRLQEQVRLVAGTHASVLISGENGTGKELVARAIHYNSPRCGKPLVEMNCAAIPEELIELELFGHEKGAIGGAGAQRKGKLDLADESTIFLDEIGDMPLKTQARLLRFLQEGKFERVGGNKGVEVDVRVITATSEVLEEKTRKGNFLEDLFYRLNVVPLNIPPLRERKEDIPLLAQHFLDLFCRHEGRELKEISSEAVKLIKDYDWPGNVKELKNIMERLVIMTPGKVVTEQHIPDYFSRRSAMDGKIHGVDNVRDLSSFREAREEFEKEFIIQKLEENDWNISKTAEMMELERSNLHKKIKSYGINLNK